MWWISMSEYALTAALLRDPVRWDACVVPTVGLWQVAQPIALNSAVPLAIDVDETCCPFSTTPPVGAGANRRMKLENADVSSSPAAAVPAPGLLASSG